MNSISINLLRSIIIGAVLILGHGMADGQSGGSFEITKSVITGSGGAVSGGNFEAGVTAGEAASSSSSGGIFVLFGGFWSPEQLAPTAASVSVSGRVTDTMGQPIVRASIRLTDSQGATRSALTNPFGYFKIPGVLAGETYIVEVSHKNFIFATPQVVTVDDEISDLNFVAIGPSVAEAGTRNYEE